MIVTIWGDCVFLFPESPFDPKVNLDQLESSWLSFTLIL